MAHKIAIAKKAQPTVESITNPNIGIKQNTTTAPADDLPEVNATISHSIPQTTNIIGLITNNVPNKEDIPLPP